MKYKLLGRSGLRVSELCLGTLTFGTEWGTGADRAGSKLIFDAFVQAGGNFIDTANRYTEGTSERYVGEFIAKQRDYFVLATKYSLFDRKGDLNNAGNHRKNLMRSVEGSLQRLNTSHIDLLWVHAWDFTVREDEVMRALDDLVRAGKVLHIGVSDTPAWIAARASTIAELRGWTAFTALQVEYSLLERSAERDLLPMARAMGMAMTPWAPLAGGALTGKYLKADKGDKRLKAESKRLNARNTAIAQAVADMAAETGISAAQIALAWLRQQGPEIIPIVGARHYEQFADSLGCLHVQLDASQMNRLDEVSRIELGFPHEFLRSDNVKELLFAGMQDRMD